MIYIDDDTKERFQKINFDSMYFLINFDNAITDKHSSDTWSVITCNMDSKKVNELEELNSKYISIELDNILNYNEKCNRIKNIWKQKISILKKSNISGEKISDIISSENDIKIRDGAKEFFRAAYENEIPVIIVSDGITEVINCVLKHNDCIYDNIQVISNSILLGSKNKIIHPLNKNELSISKDIKTKLKDRKTTVLLASSINDINMLSKTRLKNSIKMVFLEKNINENFDIFLNYFNIIFTHNARLDNINNIIKNM